MAETALGRRYRFRLEQLRDSTLRRVLAAAASDTARFVETVVPIVLAAQSATVTAADAYLSAEAGMATGTSTEPWGLDPRALIGARARRGDSLESVYSRNHSVDVSSFAERMAREVNTDITLADRAATFVHTQGDTRISGYRRVTSAGACPLCVVASSRRYGKGDLRPIHAHCSCTTQSIYTAAAAGWRKPSAATIRSLYEQAGGTTAKALTTIRSADPSLPAVRVIESALGPTLVAA